MTKYILDSNAIIILLVKFKDKAVDLLFNQYTSSLAFYELNNVLWKQAYLLKQISIEEALSKTKDIVKILAIMNVIDQRDMDFASNAMNIAIKFGTTFYDSTFLHLAKKLPAVLITEDQKLRNVAHKMKINILNVDEYAKAKLWRRK